MKRILAQIILPLVLVGLLSACASSRPKPIREADYAAPIRVACVGDSITYGYGFKKRDQESYPARLGVLLGSKWVVKNFGVNGATVLKKGTRPYLSQAAFRAALEFEPDVVVIKLGTNDTMPKNWGEHKDEFESDYLELIRRFSELKTKPRVYICRPVPLFRDRGTSTDSNKVLLEIMPVIDQVARQSRLPVIDLNAPFESQPERFPDGVHPDPNGAMQMARHVYSALRGKEAPRE